MGAGLLKLVFVMVVVVGLSTGGKGMVEGQVHHHVVGDDRGWDPSSDLLSWSSARTFRVGDNIWFAYSAAHENVVELHNIEEYKSCHVKNPIRMYTDGLNKVSLKEEGVRYFASGNPESCKKGLKLHVEVQPQPQPQPREKNETQTLRSGSIMAAGPTPSASAHASGLPFILFIGLLLCYVSL
ncbi:hypothetical protein LguiA_015174 [Lonicera macranthoides]